tara:strand:+ start:4666 stop:5139 length:474 start_codon:yes stop_codon:yes gene_type:complete
MRTYEIVVTEKYYSTKKDSLKLYKETDSMFLKEQSMTKQSGIDYRLAPNRLRTLYHMKINTIKQEQGELMRELIGKKGKPAAFLKPPVSLTISFFSKNKRIQDLDGLLGSQKGYIDGTVGLVIEDDSAEIMPCIKLHYKSSVKEPKVIFEFEEMQSE